MNPTTKPGDTWEMPCARCGYPVLYTVRGVYDRAIAVDMTPHICSPPKPPESRWRRWVRKWVWS